MAGLKFRFKGNMLRPPGQSRQAKSKRVWKYVLWFAVGFVFLRGIVSFLPKQPVIAASKIPDVVNSSAESFAQAFAQAYYTFDHSKPEAFTAAIQPFVSKSLLSESAGLDLRTIHADYKAIRTIPWTVQQTKDDRADIVVRVEVQETKDAKDAAVTTSLRYLQVPIAWTGKGYYVYDFPTVLPPPTKEDGEIAALPSGTVPDELLKTIRSTLDDFYKAYANQSSSQLKYFMADGKEIQGYNGQYSYSGIKDIQVLDETNTDSKSKMPIQDVKAFVSSQWQDTNGIPQMQHMTLTLTYSQDRWYISKIEGGYKS